VSAMNLSRAPGALRVVGPLLVAASLSLTPQVARAQSVEDALLADCYRLRREGNFSEALLRCSGAVAASRTGRSLAQLALTEVGLERWPFAVAHLTAALDDREHPWVIQNRASLERTLQEARSHLPADAVIPAVPPVHATQPATAASPPAAPPAPPPVVAAPPVAPASQPAPSPTALVSPAAAVAAPSGPSTRRVLAFVAGGLAVGGFGLALGAWGLREGGVRDYNAACPSGAAEAGTVGRCTTAREVAQRDAATWETIATVGLVAGGVFSVASAVLFATESASRGATARVRCDVLLGAAGGQCTVRF
jgi:hypothetical protein